MPPKLRSKYPATVEKRFAVFLELLERKWALRILWALHRHEEEEHYGITFRALQQRLGNPSPTVLNKRIQELLAEGILAIGPDGYELGALVEPRDEFLQALRAWFEARDR